MGDTPTWTHALYIYTHTHRCSHTRIQTQKQKNKNKLQTAQKPDKALCMKLKRDTALNNLWWSRPARNHDSLLTRSCAQQVTTWTRLVEKPQAPCDRTKRNACVHLKAPSRWRDVSLQFAVLGGARKPENQNLSAKCQRCTYSAFT